MGGFSSAPVATTSTAMPYTVDTELVLEVARTFHPPYSDTHSTQDVKHSEHYILEAKYAERSLNLA